MFKIIVEKEIFYINKVVLQGAIIVVIINTAM